MTVSDNPDRGAERNSPSGLGRGFARRAPIHARDTFVNSKSRAPGRRLGRSLRGCKQEGREARKTENKPNNQISCRSFFTATPTDTVRVSFFVPG